MQAQQLKQEFVATFLRNGETEKRIRTKILTADKQACAFGIGNREQGNFKTRKHLTYPCL